MATRKCVIGVVTGNDTKCQTVQVHGLAGELLDAIEVLHPYGFTTVPIKMDADGKGAESLLVDCNGATVRTVLPPQDRRYRPRRGSHPGDVSVYHAKDQPTAATVELAQARMTFTDDGEAEAFRWILRVGDSTLECTHTGVITLKNTQAEVELNDAHIRLTIGTSRIVMTDGMIHLDALST